MKKNYTLLFTIILLFQLDAQAQNAQGCDGVRYYYDVFNEVAKTTVQYGTNLDAAGNSFTLMMDVYQPVGDTQSKRPLVIWAHGGAFVSGDRTEMDTLCTRFAQQGFVTATISYRLYPLLDLGIPDSLQMLDAAMKAVGDMKAAIRYFRQDEATVDQFRIDPDFIVVGGLSAGAIMAVHAAYLDQEDDILNYFLDILNTNGGLEGTTGSVDNLSYSSEVSAVINLSGAIHKLDWIQADEPPITSYHGTADDVVPYNHGLSNVLGFTFMSLNGSGSIHARTDELGLNNSLISVPGANHETAYNSSAFSSYQEEFVEEGQRFIYNLLCEGILIDVEGVVTMPIISAFPNPSDHLITLDLSQLKSSYQIAVYDVAGRLLMQQKDQLAPQFQIYKSNVGIGIFFVQVRSDDSAIAPILVKIIFK